MKTIDLLPLSSITVYVDMDGVLVDTYTYIGNLIGVSHYNQITPDQWEHFYKNVNAEELFSSLDEFPTATRLLDIVLRFAGRYTLLSSPLNHDVAGSIRGKKIWLAKHPEIHSSNAIFESRKDQFAMSNGKPNVLIDDSNSNITKWNNAGGIGILYDANKHPLSVVVNGLKETIAIIRS